MLPAQPTPRLRPAASPSSPPPASCLPRTTQRIHRFITGMIASIAFLLLAICQCPFAIVRKINRCCSSQKVDPDALAISRAVAQNSSQLPEAVLAAGLSELEFPASEAQAAPEPQSMQ